MKSKSGFTLIELLVVITIIAILASLGASAFKKVSAKNSGGPGRYSAPADSRSIEERAEQARRAAAENPGAY